MSKKYKYHLYSIPIEDGSYLKIQVTANAWWKREYKVRLLLSAFRDGCSIPEACKRADIKLYQYKYFRRTHPGIDQIREYYKSALIGQSKKIISQEIERNPKFALRYLEKSEPSRFPPSRLLRKIELIEEDRLEEQDEFLEEIRRLKMIAGMYQEVTNELKPSIGGWYKQRVDEADKAVRAYNHVHKRNNERIKRNPVVDPADLVVPRSYNRETKHYVVSPEELEKDIVKAKDQLFDQESIL